MTTINHRLTCIDCGEPHEPSITILHCTKCDSPLEVEYLDPPSAVSPRLPLANPAGMMSLGEGSTPFVPLARTADALGLRRLYAKLEFEAPTGSFKDRGSAVLISAAKEAGITEFVEDSSGNAGASLSAYAAAAGLKAHVFAPSSAGQGKKDQIRVFGAQLHEIDGPRQTSTDAAIAYARERDIPWLSHNMSPYFAEGMKSFACEIAAAFPDVPAHIVFPVGNGSLITGAHRGFRELLESGTIDRIPALQCVQSERVQPIVAAINGADWTPPTNPATVASGIAVTSPPRLSQVVKAVRATGGAGVAVSEDAILTWQRLLAAIEGIFGEATSAAAFAGLEMLVRAGSIKPDDFVVVPVTGSGLKEPLAPSPE